MLMSVDNFFLNFQMCLAVFQSTFCAYHIQVVDRNSTQKVELATKKTFSCNPCFLPEGELPQLEYVPFVSDNQHSASIYSFCNQIFSHFNQNCKMVIL